MSNQPATALVLVHGLFSSPATWSRLEEVMSHDSDLASLQVLKFQYASPKVSLSPLRRIPDFNDVADSLALFLEVEAAPFRKIILCTHSQGGLVAQRYLSRSVMYGRGKELVRIRRVVMFACPNNGSEFALSLRRGFWLWRHAQERELRPIVDSVADSQRTVNQKIVHADAVTTSSCPIRIAAYAGEIDNIVKPASAKGLFSEVGVLPGDHNSIIQPESTLHRTFTTLRVHLLEVLGEIEPNLESVDPREEGAMPPLPAPANARELMGESLYRSDSEETPFQSWYMFARNGVAREKFPRSAGTVIGIRSTAREIVGLDKPLPTLAGTIHIEYQIAEFDRKVAQVYFAVIPMQDPGPQRGGWIEVGADAPEDPRNPGSLYRVRWFVPAQHYGDSRWHEHTISFDFGGLDGAFFSIFSVRINEGLSQKGDATVLLRDVRVERAQKY